MTDTRVAEIERRLRTALAPRTLEIRDDSARHAGHAGARGGGGHYHVYIVAEAFDGLSPLQRHRRVYAALQDLIPAQVHALAITARTPEETSPA